eukprot:scaffold100852_cov33-Prasinocladus_malaysianus.AAC.1
MKPVSSFVLNVDCDVPLVELKGQLGSGEHEAYSICQEEKLVGVRFYLIYRMTYRLEVLEPAAHVNKGPICARTPAAGARTPRCSQALLAAQAPAGGVEDCIILNTSSGQNAHGIYLDSTWHDA